MWSSCSKLSQRVWVATPTSSEACNLLLSFAAAGFCCCSAAAAAAWAAAHGHPQLCQMHQAWCWNHLQPLMTHLRCLKHVPDWCNAADIFTTRMTTAIMVGSCLLAFLPKAGQSITGCFASYICFTVEMCLSRLSLLWDVFCC